MSKKTDRTRTHGAQHGTALIRAAAGAGLLLIAACGIEEPPAVAEDVAGPAEQAAPSPSSPWNELPLEPGTFHEQSAEYRSDTIDIPLWSGGELEYKLFLEAGATIVYEWTAENLTNGDELWSEFHGHTDEPVGDVLGDLMFYRNATGGSDKGALVAPFTGEHGWYLRNDSAEDITVRLEVSGYYELVGM